MITILRVVKQTTTDKDGNSVISYVKRQFPCKVNGAVPLNHQMCTEN